MFALAAITIAFAAASPHQELFDRAVELYAQDEYEAASSLFSELEAECEANAAIYYNLGNCDYRLGRLAPAIANYERSLQLEPGMDSARSNLAQCVQHTQDKMEPPAPPDWERILFFWHAALAPSTAYLAAMAAWWGFWAALAIRCWRSIRYLRGATVILAFCALAFICSAWVKAHPASLAVANADILPVHYGASSMEPVRFELHEGDRVRVERLRGEWARIATEQGKRGWVPISNLVLVNKPGLF